MLITEATITTTASPKNVWEIWSDINCWNTWDPDVRSCTFQGKFEKGAKALLQPTSGPKVQIEIVDSIIDRQFTSISYLPLGTRLSFEHKMEEVSGKVQITHRVKIRGGLSLLFYCILGSAIRRGLPIALRNLAQKAEQLSN